MLIGIDLKYTRALPASGLVRKAEVVREGLDLARIRGVGAGMGRGLVMRGRAHHGHTGNAAEPGSCYLPDCERPGALAFVPHPHPGDLRLRRTAEDGAATLPMQR